MEGGEQVRLKVGVVRLEGWGWGMVGRKVWVVGDVKVVGRRGGEWGTWKLGNRWGGRWTLGSWEDWGMEGGGSRRWGQGWKVEVRCISNRILEETATLPTFSLKDAKMQAVCGIQVVSQKQH